MGNQTICSYESNPRIAEGFVTHEGPSLRWYGERGIVNALVSHVATSPVERTAALLAAVKWADGGRPAWVSTISRVRLLVEWGLADFGNPDLVIIADSSVGRRCVFVEAKIGPYLSSMVPNRVGMRQAGFNSSINGQLALKYRFATALQQASGRGGPVEEATGLLQQYRVQLRDPRSVPRRLAKPEIVQIFSDCGVLGLAESRCCYVALTWDAETRPFFSDPFVAREDGLPHFVDQAGNDIYDAVRPRLGWLGYQHLDSALDLNRVDEYQTVLATMIPALEPDGQAYAAAETGFLGEATSPESVTQAAKFRMLFTGYRVVESRGSFSVLENGETIAKIIPKRDAVFVGIRDTKSPQSWCPGPLDRVSIRGVPFLGLHVPVEHADDAQLAMLVRGIATTSDIVTE